MACIASRCWEIKYSNRSVFTSKARLKRQRLEKYKREQDIEARRKEMHLKIDSELAKRLQAEQEKKRVNLDISVNRF